MKEIVVLGGGGHGKVVVEAIIRERKYKLEGIIDPCLKINSKVMGVPILGGDECLIELYKRGVRFAAIGIGTVGQYAVKKKIWNRLIKIGFELPSILHPHSSISLSAKIGPGAFIAAGAVIGAGAVLKDGVIVNTCASIDHDCCIGKFSHVAPGAILCGNVSVGECVHVGAGAIIIQNLTVSDKSFIKAGHRITK